jgi:drug/metabolite transporter (DMT)-like permease
VLVSWGSAASQMLLNAQIAPLVYSLLATLTWGMSDFTGGYASRRTNAFLLTTITHVSGAGLMLGLAVLMHSPFPTARGIAWSMAAGFLGGTALAVFYKALAVGKMGLTAPLSALLGAAIPTLAGIFREGLPSRLAMAGFVLAAIGIWLISRVEAGGSRPEGIGLAFISGLGFAGFFLCIRQAGNIPALWAAGFSRLASLLATGTIVVAARQFRPLAKAGIGLGILAGALDSTGSAMFVRASQSGRLDAAVVISSLYPAVTVLLARFLLDEHVSRWRMVGLLAALLAVPMIAM